MHCHTQVGLVRTLYNMFLDLRGQVLPGRVPAIRLGAEDHDNAPAIPFSRAIIGQKLAIGVTHRLCLPRLWVAIQARRQRTPNEFNRMGRTRPPPHALQVCPVIAHTPPPATRRRIHHRRVCFRQHRVEQDTQRHFFALLLKNTRHFIGQLAADALPT